MLAVLLMLHLGAAAPGPLAFADELMRQRDYHRAITEYKRAIFENDDAGLRGKSMLRISHAYRRSARYASAVEYAASVLADESAPPESRRAANLALGMTYLDWGRGALGLPFLEAATGGGDTAFPLLCIGLVDLEAGRPDRAAGTFRRAASAAADTAVREEGLRLAADSDAFARAPRKSPGLATAISLVLPGAGQAYSGHHYDGLQAFVFVTAFTLATVGVHQYERSVKDELGWTYVGASITALFHVANLMGAQRTAQYHNWKRANDFGRAARQRVLRHEPDILQP